MRIRELEQKLELEKSTNKRQEVSHTHRLTHTHKHARLTLVGQLILTLYHRPVYLVSELNLNEFKVTRQKKILQRRVML